MTDNDFSDIFIPDFWRGYLVRMLKDLANAGLDATASNSDIFANVGGWFNDLQNNTQTELIKSLRLLSDCASAETFRDLSLLEQLRKSAK